MKLSDVRPKTGTDVGRSASLWLSATAPGSAYSHIQVASLAASCRTDRQLLAVVARVFEAVVTVRSG